MGEKGSVPWKIGGESRKGKIGEVHVDYVKTQRKVVSDFDGKKGAFPP